MLTNAGKVDDALAAFDKVIAADPNRADAYYWKGVNMIGKATLQGDKMVAPPGTAEAFQKYLELQPTGTYAEQPRRCWPASAPRWKPVWQEEASQEVDLLSIQQLAVHKGGSTGRPFSLLGQTVTLRRTMHLLSFASGPRRGTVKHLSFLPILWCVRFLKCEDEWQHQPLPRFPLH